MRQGRRRNCPSRKKRMRERKEVMKKRRGKRRKKMEKQVQWGASAVTAEAVIR